VGITLEQMAKQARLSKFHFTSAFRRAAGSTPYQYVVGRRLARARKLLRGTRAPITDLALECGFSSHAHLTSTVTARYGVSPAVYRRLTSVQSSGGWLPRSRVPDPGADACVAAPPITIGSPSTTACFPRRAYRLRGVDPTMHPAFPPATQRPPQPEHAHDSQYPHYPGRYADLLQGLGRWPGRHFFQ